MKSEQMGLFGDEEKAKDAGGLTVTMRTSGGRTRQMKAALIEGSLAVTECVCNCLGAWHISHVPTGLELPGASFPSEVEAAEALRAVAGLVDWTQPLKQIRAALDANGGALVDKINEEFWRVGYPNWTEGRTYREEPEETSGA